MSDSCHSNDGSKIDWLLIVSTVLVALGYGAHLFLEQTVGDISYVGEYTQSVYELMNKMWWGILFGLLFVGLMIRIPKAFVHKVIGKGGTWGGRARAAAGGVLLDLCSHGILLVGMQLYKRGASLGQVMAFLISSPWNSLSLTIILISLIGLWWTLGFIVISVVIALITGWIFDQLVAKGVLPENPNDSELPKDFAFFKEAKQQLRETRFTGKWFVESAKMSVMESRMILRWIMLGIVLASLLRTFMDTSTFAAAFGPDVWGVLLTLGFATILEVCSEGSAPIAADIMNRAKAPGNGFTFLMAGVSTDYTEIMALRETTHSWKIALFLPLITLPQIIAVGVATNYLAT